MLPPGRGHFAPSGVILTKLGRGPLGDATYMLRLYALKIVYVFLFVFFCKLELSEGHNSFHAVKKAKF